MEEPDVVPFAVWSVITMAIIVVAGLVYRVYVRRKNHEKFTP